MRAMISQPMNGKTYAEITATKLRTKNKLEGMGYEVVNTFFTEEMDDHEVVSIPLYFLAKALENMSLCDMVYFCKGWKDARGCRIEHEAAREYGLEIVYE